MDENDTFRKLRQTDFDEMALEISSVISMPHHKERKKEVLISILESHDWTLAECQKHIKENMVIQTASPVKILAYLRIKDALKTL